VAAPALDARMNMEIDTYEQLSFNALFESHLFSEECGICLGEHDEEIHAATLRLRAWFRRSVTRYFDTEVPFIS